MDKFRPYFLPSNRARCGKTMNTPEFKFYCCHCHQPLRCDTRFAGGQIECPRCLKLIRIPNPPADSAFAPVSPETGRTWEFGLGALNPPVPKSQEH